MRCEFCRDPGHIPKAVEICRDCAPRFAAMENVVKAAMAWCYAPGRVEDLMGALRDACATLAALLKPDAAVPHASPFDETRTNPGRKA